MMYKIEGNDKFGEFKMSRKFDEFYEIRNIMVIRWPGCFIPSLPGKKTIVIISIKLISKKLFY